VRKVRDILLRFLLRVWLHPRPDGLERLGSSYGGWWVPKWSLLPGNVAYCAGAGEDVTFDLALHTAGLRVTTFDPTPRAIEHVGVVAPNDGHFRFVPVGWWDAEAVIRFYAPRNPLHVSHSIVNLQKSRDYFTARVATVRALAEELGDTRIDIIKMDVEGAELRVIASLVEDGPMPAVMCVEFDQPQSFRHVVRAISALKGKGFRAVKIEGWNLTLVRQASRQMGELDYPHVGATATLGSDIGLRNEGGSLAFGGSAVLDHGSHLDPVSPEIASLKNEQGAESGISVTAGGSG